MHNQPCKTKKCGCEDQGLHTPTPCIHDTFECPNPDPCPETFSACCTIFDKDTIVDVGFNKGDSLCVILQKIALFLTNPTCANPNSTCKSALGLGSMITSPTTIKVGWSPNGTPTSYQVEYKKATDVTWSANPVLPNTSFTDVIGGLAPNTTYYIRVNSICASGPVDSQCYSVTISVLTKPTS
jgi:hypothetical protein